MVNNSCWCWRRDQRDWLCFLHLLQNLAREPDVVVNLLLQEKEEETVLSKEKKRMDLTLMQQMMRSSLAKFSKTNLTLSSRVFLSLELLTTLYRLLYPGISVVVYDPVYSDCVLLLASLVPLVEEPHSFLSWIFERTRNHRTKLSTELRRANSKKRLPSSTDSPLFS